MSNLILLTNQYPYETGEEFLDAELQVLSEHYNIWIIATNACTAEIRITRDVPANVKVMPLYSKRYGMLGKIRFTISALLSSAFYRELLTLGKNKKLNYHNVLKCLKYIVHGNEVYDSLRILFKKGAMNISDSVVYSYWFMHPVYSMVKLKQKYHCRIISRAHDGDVVEQETNGYYLPLRTSLLKNIDRCYTISYTLKNYVVSHYHVNGKKIFISPLGTSDCGIFTPTSMRPFTIVSCAYIVPLKRIPLIADAIGMLPTDCDVKWIHIGGGESLVETVAYAKEKCKNIKLEFMGDVTHDALLEFYKANFAHLFVNVSTSEGMPVTIMEAMSFGIPIIATDVGAVHEMVVDGQNGLLLRADVTANELKESILSIMNADVAAYYKIREQSRHYWDAHFNADRNYNDFALSLM